jgi:hypothetical protein
MWSCTRLHGCQFSLVLKIDSMLTLGYTEEIGAGGRMVKKCLSVNTLP